MVVRKAFYYWQFVAIAVLPAWLLIGWALWGQSGDFGGVALAAPFLVLALLGVAGLTFARKSAREKRAASWWDVGVAGAWHALVIGTGFFGDATQALAALSVAAGIIAFWGSAWQLIDDTRKRVRRVFETLQTGGAVPYRPQQKPLDAGEYVVIRPPEPPR
jgi:hypothetical protein